MSETTLITETAATTTESESVSQPAEQASATGAEAEGQQQQAEGAEAGKDGEKAKDEGAPESYEFVAPEGQEYSQEMLKAFSESAKEIGLSQGKASSMLDKLAPALAEREQAAMAAAREKWEADSKADKEFGGDGLEQNMALAKKALETFGTPELRELLNASGLGSHPELIRAFYRAGKAISEDKFVGGSAAGADSRDARSMYKATQLNP